MLDINLGNKTLIVGVLIALILSYGMVNFDSGAGTSPGVQGLERQAAYSNSHRPETPDPGNTPAAVAQESSGDLFDGSSLPKINQGTIDDVEDEDDLSPYERRMRRAQRL